MLCAEMKLLMCQTFLLGSKLRGKALKCKKLDGPPNYGKGFFILQFTSTNVSFLYPSIHF